MQAYQTYEYIQGTDRLGHKGFNQGMFHMQDIQGHAGRSTRLCRVVSYLFISDMYLLVINSISNEWIDMR